MSDSYQPNNSTDAERTAGQPATDGPARRVLLVDRQPTLQPLLAQCRTEHGRVDVLYADTLAQAREMVSESSSIDVAVIDPDLDDGSGLDLARELSASKTVTQTLVVSSTTNFELAQTAMRAGASDYIFKPDAPDADAFATDLTDRVSAALTRQWKEREQVKRIRRLKKLCKKLNQARIEVSDQVDVLCNDLVTAYQELAVQMQNVVNVSGFQAVIGEELDLEAVLRKTLEHLVQKVGPCNAAIFLPASMDEYSLGGYVNYDCNKESADMLLQHLADVLAPRVSEQGIPLHLTSNAELKTLLGDDWNYLAESQLVTFACNSDDEPLAVVALFRDSSQPFARDVLDMCSTIADMMGETLAKIIRIHHRATPDLLASDDYSDTEYTPDGDTYLPPDEWDGYDQQAEPFEDDGDPC